MICVLIVGNGKGIIQMDIKRWKNDKYNFMWRKCTRLWPVSRTLMPKQFVKLFLNKSLFQLTVERNSKVCKSQFIVSNSEQYFLALDQLEELNKSNNNYLLEPIGRNTAPAIALACMALDYNEIVLVTSSDHLIKDEKRV